MTKITKKIFRETKNGCRDYLILNVKDMDVDILDDNVLAAAALPELIPFYIIETDDSSQMWYDTSRLHHIAEDIYMQDDFQKMIGRALYAISQKGVDVSHIVIFEDTVYVTDTGALRFAYLPGYDNGKKSRKDDDEITLRKNDIKRFIRNMASDKLSSMTRAGYEIPDELLEKVTDAEYKMFMTGDFGKFGNLDRFNPASYEMPVNCIISDYYRNK